MAMGGPILHLRGRRNRRPKDCDPEYDDYDDGYLCPACEKWAKQMAEQRNDLQEVLHLILREIKAPRKNALAYIKSECELALKRTGSAPRRD